MIKRQRFTGFRWTVFSASAICSGLPIFSLGLVDAGVVMEMDAGLASIDFNRKLNGLTAMIEDYFVVQENGTVNFRDGIAVHQRKSRTGILLRNVPAIPS